MSAQPTTGSATAPAAVPATMQGSAPSTAAPSSAPPANVTAVTTKAKGKNYAPRSTMPSASTKSPGLSTMLHAVSDMPYYDKPYYNVTYKVPNFMMFFYVLGLMDNQMAHTKRFTDANPDWIFFVSQLYYSVLLFYFTLKCQLTGAQISNEQLLFLEFIENNFDIKNAKIAGPLVPFFQSLAANAGPTKAFGNLVFGIPNNLEVTQANHFLFNNRLNANLPSVIFILDQMMRYINNFAPVAPANAAPVSANMNTTDQFYFNIFGTAAANASANRICMHTPSARSEPQLPTHVASGFLGSSNVWRSSLPFDPATNNSTYTSGNGANALALDQILGFRGFGGTVNSTFTWFTQVGRLMQPYADFWKDSGSLGAISTSGIGIGYIITRPAPGAANVVAREITVRDVRYMPAGTPRYQIVEYSTFQVYAEHSEENLDLVTEQQGLLCQLDFDWTPVNGSAAAVHPGPTRGNVVNGPIDTLVIQRWTPWVNVSVAIPNIISGYYHAPAAMKFE
ncbi:coat protein [Rhizoctonia oryzae-sativae partitivirus 3]|nr:coat protein [Rhizoctonia oryzae-sativae partitivirus 3]